MRNKQFQQYMQEHLGTENAENVQDVGNVNRVEQEGEIEEAVVPAGGSEEVVLGPAATSVAGETHQDIHEERLPESSPRQSQSQAATAEKMELDSQNLKSTQMAKRDMALQRLAHGSHSPDQPPQTGSTNLQHWKGVNVHCSVHQVAKKQLLHIDTPEQRQTAGHGSPTSKDDDANLMDDDIHRKDEAAQPYFRPSQGPGKASDGPAPQRLLKGREKLEVEHKTTVQDIFNVYQVYDERQKHSRYDQAGPAKQANFKVNDNGHVPQAELPNGSSPQKKVTPRTFRVVMEPGWTPRRSQKDSTQDIDQDVSREPGSPQRPRHQIDQNRGSLLLHDHGYQIRNGTRHRSGGSSQNSGQSKNADIGEVMPQQRRDTKDSGMTRETRETMYRKARRSKVHSRLADGGDAYIDPGAVHDASRQTSQQSRQDMAVDRVLMPSPAGEQRAPGTGAAARWPRRGEHGAHVGTGQLVQASQEGRLNKMNADFTAPHQVRSPKFIYGDPQTQNTCSAGPGAQRTGPYDLRKNALFKGAYKGLGLLADRKSSDWEQACASPPRGKGAEARPGIIQSSGLGPRANRLSHQKLYSRRIAKMAAATNPHPQEDFQEAQALQANPELHRRLEQMFQALEDQKYQNKGIEQVMANAGADARHPLAHAQFVKGYASFAAQHHQAAASADKTYNEYQTQLNEFLNFKQHIGLASMPQEDVKRDLGRQEGLASKPPVQWASAAGHPEATDHIRIKDHNRAGATASHIRRSGPGKLQHQSDFIDFHGVPTAIGQRQLASMGPGSASKALQHASAAKRPPENATAATVLSPSATSQSNSHVHSEAENRPQRHTNIYSHPHLHQYNGPKLNKYKSRANQCKSGSFNRKKAGHRDYSIYRTQGNLQKPRAAQLADFASFLKDKDLEIIQKITNYSKKLQGLPRQGRAGASVNVANQRNGTNKKRSPYAYGHGAAALAYKWSHSAASEEREMLNQIGNADLIQAQILKQMQSESPGPASGSKQGVGTPYDTAQKSEAEMVRNIERDIGNQYQRRPPANSKMDNTFVVQVPQTHVTESHLQREAGFQSGKPARTAARRNEVYVDTKLKLHNKFADRATKQSQSPPSSITKETLKLQATCKLQGSVFTPGVRRGGQTVSKYDDFIRETGISGTPNSHDTQYGPHFLSKIQAYGTGMPESLNNSARPKPANTGTHLTIDYIVGTKNQQTGQGHISVVHNGGANALRGNTGDGEPSQSKGSRSKEGTAPRRQDGHSNPASGVTEAAATKQDRINSDLLKIQDLGQTSGEEPAGALVGAATADQAVRTCGEPENQIGQINAKTEGSPSSAQVQEYDGNQMMDGTPPPSKSPLKNKRIASLSQQNSSKSLRQAELPEKQIIERSQENSQATNELLNGGETLRGKSNFGALPSPGLAEEGTEEALTSRGGQPQEDEGNNININIKSLEKFMEQERFTDAGLTPSGLGSGPQQRSRQTIVMKRSERDSCPTKPQELSPQELKISVHATDILNDFGTAARRARDASPKGGLRTMTDSIKSSSPQGGQTNPLKSTPRSQRTEENLPDLNRFHKERSLLPFSLELLPTLDVITVSPQEAEAGGLNNQHTQQFSIRIDKLDQKEAVGVRGSLPNSDFPGHGHGPIGTRRGGIMIEEASDMKKNDIRSNDLALEMPRASDFSKGANRCPYDRSKLRNDRGGTAGAPTRKMRELGQQARYNRSQAGGPRNLGFHLETEATVSQPMPGPLLQTQANWAPVTAAVAADATLEDPARRGLSHASQPLYALKNLKRRHRRSIKSSIYSPPSTFFAHASDCSPNNINKKQQPGNKASVMAQPPGPANTRSQMPPAAKPASDMMRLQSEAAKQKMRMERYKQHKHQVEQERLRRAKMAQNRCLQRQHVQNKNKSLRIVTEAGDPGQKSQARASVPGRLVRLQNKSREYEFQTPLRITPSLNYGGGAAAPTGLVTATHRFSALRRGHPGQFPHTVKNERRSLNLPQHVVDGLQVATARDEQRKTQYQTQYSAQQDREFTKTEETMISPQITYQKILPDSAVSSYDNRYDNRYDKHSTLLQPAFHVEITQQQLRERELYDRKQYLRDTLKRRGTLECVNIDDFFA